MPLFADVTGTDVGMIVLGVANLFFGFLTVWVKARTDSEIATLKLALVECKADHTEAGKVNAESRVRIEVLERGQDLQRTLKHAAVNRANALAARVALLEHLSRARHPEDPIPVYLDGSGGHESFPPESPPTEGPS